MDYYSDSDSEHSEQKKFMFIVQPWCDLQQWHLCTVIASNVEECCDFLRRRFAGSDDEIEDAVCEARRFELKDTSQKTGIITVA
jgi:hypothetical protein